MGKILDTITVLFKGDTSDLKRKKKEAEDLAAETAKNIKEIETSTVATSAAVENTNKALTQTESLTTNIGEGITAWILAAQQASGSINEALGAEKAHREQIRTEKGLRATEKAAQAVEKTVISIAKQFATAALGALTVGRAVGLFKDVVSGTLDLQRESFSLNIDPAKIDAYGRAAQAAGSSIEEYTEALKTLKDLTGGLTGPVLEQTLEGILKKVYEAKNPIAAQKVGEIFNLPQGIIRAARKGAFTPENIENIKKVDAGVIEATKKVEVLAEAWAEFRTNIRGTAIDIENSLLGPLTKFLNLINESYKSAKSLHGILATGSNNPNAAPVLLFNSAKNQNSTSIPQAKTSFPLTKGNNSVSNTTTFKIGDVIVKAPEGVDPHFFGEGIANELRKHIVQLQQNFNGPIVG